MPDCCCAFQSDKHQSYAQSGHLQLYWTQKHNRIPKLAEAATRLDCNTTWLSKFCIGRKNVEARGVLALSAIVKSLGLSILSD